MRARQPNDATHRPNPCRPVHSGRYGGLMFWIAMQAAGTLIGIMLLFRGYQIGEASAVAVFEFSLLIFASAWAWYLWGQTVPPLGLHGMALIMLSGAAIAIRRPA